ncbi:MAG: type II secretion system F family protein [Streptosporangiaceae bacterium]|jgi:Flp pilus assembly protein TadB
MSRMRIGGLPGAVPALTVAAGHQGTAPLAGGWSSSLIAVLAAVFVALLVLALLAVGSLTRGDRNRDLVGQIEPYGARHGPAPAAADGMVARTAVGWAARLLRSSNAEQRLAQRLDLAGIAQTPAEWVLLGGCACVVLTAALTILGGSILIGLPAGFLFGWLGMRLAVSVRITRRRAAFSDQLPDVLQFITGSLKSGFSLSLALGAVVREEVRPTAGEFARALAEARVGVDLEVALEAVANRMDCDDLRWAVMAIRIQREVGGNLAEVLGTTAGTMRERASLHRHMRGLTAEGRLSAYILTALPILVGGWLMFSDRSYMRPLYTTGLGLVMLGSAAVLFVLGALWMRVLIKVEV